MELAEKLTILARSGIRRDAAAVLLGITEDEAQEQIKNPERPDPAGAGGGGGGGGGMSLAPNGGFGDPTQVPSFVGFFHDFNDIYNIDAWTVPFKQGCWAIVGWQPDDPTPGSWAEMRIAVFNADGGDWQIVTLGGSDVQQLIDQAHPIYTRDVFFPGVLAAGMTRRLKVPYNIKFTAVYLTVGTRGISNAVTNPNPRIRVDVLAGGVAADDTFNPGTSGTPGANPVGSIFGASKPFLYPGLSGPGAGDGRNWQEGSIPAPTVPPLVGGQDQGHAYAGGALEVVVTEVPDDTPGADLNVTLVGVKTPY